MFHVARCGISADCAVTVYDAVTRDYRRHRVFADRICNGAYRVRVAAHTGQLGVCSDLAPWDLGQCPPDIALKRGPGYAVYIYCCIFLHFINIIANRICPWYIIRTMKQLTDEDIARMADSDFHADTRAVNRDVRSELRLSRLIPPPAGAVPQHATLDLHQYTEEQAWAAIMNLATSGVRTALIITGASGILHKKFPQWVAESVLSPYILESVPVNNGSFRVRFRRVKK